MYPQGPHNVPPPAYPSPEARQVHDMQVAAARQWEWEQQCAAAAHDYPDPAADDEYVGRHQHPEDVRPEEPPPVVRRPAPASPLESGPTIRMRPPTTDHRLHVPSDPQLVRAVQGRPSRSPEPRRTWGIGRFFGGLIMLLLGLAVGAGGPYEAITAAIRYNGGTGYGPGYAIAVGWQVAIVFGCVLLGLLGAVFCGAAVSIWRRKL